MRVALNRFSAAPLAAYAFRKNLGQFATLALRGMVVLFGLVAIPLALTTQPMTGLVDTVIRLFVASC